jgi:hypothetical protein
VAIRSGLKDLLTKERQSTFRSRLASSKISSGISGSRVSWYSRANSSIFALSLGRSLGLHITGLDLKKRASAVLAHEDPIELISTSLRSMGIGADIKPALIVYASLTSWLLLQRQGSMPCYLLLVGLPSTGKSFTLKLTLTLFPTAAYSEIDSGSPYVFIYSEFETRHRIVVFDEADSLPAGEDNPCASAIRSLFQDNRLAYDTTVQDPDAPRGRRLST